MQTVLPTAAQTNAAKQLNIAYRNKHLEIQQQLKQIVLFINCCDLFDNLRHKTKTYI